MGHKYDLATSKCNSSIVLGYGYADAPVEADAFINYPFSHNLLANEIDIGRNSNTAVKTCKRLSVDETMYLAAGGNCCVITPDSDTHRHRAIKDLLAGAGCPRIGLD